MVRAASHRPTRKAPSPSRGCRGRVRVFTKPKFLSSACINHKWPSTTMLFRAAENRRAGLQPAGACQRRRRLRHLGKTDLGKTDLDKTDLDKTNLRSGEKRCRPSRHA